MTTYFALKFLHIVGGAVLLGTGVGIAFFLLQAHRTGDASVIAAVGRIVIVADFLFTATAVIVQPVTGLLLALQLGYPVLTGWIALSISLYILVGCLWLPVVWMQMKLQRLAAEAAAGSTPLTPQYYRLFGLWFAFGVPAFAAVLAILWLMIAKPAF